MNPATVMGGVIMFMLLVIMLMFIAVPVVWFGFELLEKNIIDYFGMTESNALPSLEELNSNILYFPLALIAFFVSAGGVFFLELAYKERQRSRYNETQNSI